MVGLPLPGEADGLARSPRSAGVTVGRLPLLVPLRDFWRALPDPSTHAALSVAELEACLCGWLQGRGAPGMSSELAVAHFEHGTALVVLDGTDEMPPAHRALLLLGLADARPAWAKLGNRLLVTSRP